MIDHPKLDGLRADCCAELDTIAGLLADIALLNDPLTFSGGGGVKATNGPESTDPGRQQAPGAVRKAEHAMTDLLADARRAKKRLINAWAGAKVREHHEEPAETMGGHDVRYTKAQGLSRLERHLAKKARGVVNTLD